MQFLTPTPIQAATIPAALSGKDILGTAQTGTGKTGAFAIPMLAGIYEAEIRQALILAPTRELAAQIHAVLQQMGRSLKIFGTLVVGGESFNRQADDLYHGTDYIVATPGRLNDHLMEGTIRLDDIGYLVFDEVDRMLDMGFAPQIMKIMRSMPEKRQTLLFSATLPNEIMAMARTFLKDPVRAEIGIIGDSAPDVTAVTVRTTNEGKSTAILKELKVREGKILVFARTQTRTERLAMLLEREGYPVVCLHGGRSQGQRTDALNCFRRGSHRIMVATDLAGRGIDVKDIEHVINYDLPTTREDYIHRIGRTGRNGKTGQALNIVAPQDVDDEYITTGVKPAPKTVFRTRGRFGRRR